MRKQNEFATKIEQYAAINGAKIKIPRIKVESGESKKEESIETKMTDDQIQNRLKAALKEKMAEKNRA